MNRDCIFVDESQILLDITNSDVLSVTGVILCGRPFDRTDLFLFRIRYYIN